MTRRVTVAVLLSVWTILLAGGVAAYFGVRSILLSDMDARLYARVSALPELARRDVMNSPRIPQYDWDDAYVIRESDAADRGAAEQRAAYARPEVVEARVTRASQGER